ncbi:hypothetical protein Trydic_g21088 [Trypoxylus dichotomus]
MVTYPHATHTLKHIPTTAHVNMAMYADDVCIYTRSLDARVVDRRLQEALDALQTWCTQGGRIAIHPGKSTAILFSGSGCRLKKHGNPTELTIQGDHSWHSQAKYLGITLDSRLNWGAHIHKTIDRGKQMAGRSTSPTSHGDLRIGRMGDRGAMSPNQIAKLPEPDASMGPRRTLVRKKYDHSRRRRSRTDIRLHPEDRNQNIRRSKGTPKPTRVEFPGLRLQTSLEIPPS